MAIPLRFVIRNQERQRQKGKRLSKALQHSNSPRFSRSVTTAEIPGIILIWIVRTITAPHFYLDSARVITNRPFHIKYANMGPFGHIRLRASPLAAFVIATINKRTAKSSILRIH